MVHFVVLMVALVDYERHFLDMNLGSAWEPVHLGMLVDRVDFEEALVDTVMEHFGMVVDKEMLYFGMVVDGVIENFGIEVGIGDQRVEIEGDMMH